MNPQGGPRVWMFVFAGVAAVVMYAFVNVVIDGEKRRAPDALVRYLDPSYTGNDRLAPDFDLSDREGHHIHLSDLRGKTVVLHFWSRTCGPCIEELQRSIPVFEEITHDRTDLALVLVSVDRDWNAIVPLVPPELHAPILFDPQRSVVRDRYGTRLFPETWVIDPEGIIRARFDHTLPWDAPLWVSYLASIH